MEAIEEREKTKKTNKINVLLVFLNGAPGVSRTRYRRIRNPMLYPNELQGQRKQCANSRMLECANAEMLE